MAVASTAELRQALTPQDIAIARDLFLEYARWLDVDLCFQGFDGELATLPGAYAPPHGRLLLAGTVPTAFGCIALRPLAKVMDSTANTPPSQAGHAIGEVKRLFVQPARRAGGWGRRLAEALIDDARAIGYRELKLDTLEWMTDARKLYGKLGFRECAAYYDNPLPGVIYMSLEF
ncbi:MAG: GNAT family N-acetyltransferase [Betaproteobacteria bacterium]